MSITALKKLIASSKASVLVAVLTVATFALYKGLITRDDWTALLTVLVPSWMLAHAGETGARHIAEAKKAEADSWPPTKWASTAEDNDTAPTVEDVDVTAL